MPEEVYRFEGYCPEYDCTLEVNPLPLRFKRIRFCDMDVVTESRRVTVARYAHSYPFGPCFAGLAGDEAGRVDGSGRQYCVWVDLSSSTGLASVSSRAAVAVRRAVGVYQSGVASVLFTMRTWLSSVVDADAARFPLALVGTLVLEVPALLVMARLAFRARCGDNRRTILVGVLASCLTLPMLWIAMHVAADPGKMLIAGEVGVAIVEAVLYKALLGVSTVQAIALSAVANGLSCSAGLMLS